MRRFLLKTYKVIYNTMYINSTKVIDIISTDELERNTLKNVNQIITYIKAFYADIYGPFIYNWRILGIMKNECINFRIDMHSLNILLNILALHFKIIEEDVIQIGIFPIYYTYKLVSKDNNLKIHPIIIKALLINKKTFICLYPDFDIELLTEDDSSLYIRSIVPNIRFIIDKITYIKERICIKKFCSLQKIHPLKAPSDVAQIIDTARDLIQKGWTMDDNLLGENTWIIFIWGNFIKNPTINRSNSNNEKIVNNDICSLCHEKFKNDDIILNTSCHHNFHWNCSNENDGLKNWVTKHNRLCCPYCRDLMF